MCFMCDWKTGHDERGEKNKIYLVSLLRTQCFDVKVKRELNETLYPYPLLGKYRTFYNTCVCVVVVYSTFFFCCISPFSTLLSFGIRATHISTLCVCVMRPTVVYYPLHSSRYVCVEMSVVHDINVICSNRQRQEVTQYQYVQRNTQKTL